MRILITGNQGFIGRHLTAELKSHGYDVCGHDRIDGDLANPNVFAGAVAKYQPDRVVHLAAEVGRLFGERDVMVTTRQNATMCALVGRVCGEQSIPVMYASSSEVYGDHGDHVCHELTTPKLPHNLYGLTKRWGEEALRLTAPERLRIVRLSMPYGPGAPPGRGRRALDTFLWQAHHQKPITVHRGAERSWCWVGDTVRALRMILERGDYDVYNVGRSDRPISMLTLAHKCCDLAGAPYSLIDEVDPPPMQTVVKRLSNARLLELGWQPTVELDEGLQYVYDWVTQFPAEVAA